MLVLQLQFMLVQAFSIMCTGLTWFCTILRCEESVHSHVCTTGVGAEAMAQGSRSACVAGAAVGMAKQRTESMHTLAMHTVQQHCFSQHHIWNLVGHHLSAACTRSSIASRLTAAADRILGMLCRQQHTLRLVQLIQRPVQLHPLYHRPCKRPSSKAACTQLSTSTKAQPVCLHSTDPEPLLICTGQKKFCERDPQVSIVWSVPPPLKKCYTKFFL